jgi:hypothetical protein
MSRQFFTHGTTLALLTLCVAMAIADNSSAQNAKFFNLTTSGSLTNVKSYNWQPNWHSVLSGRATDGTLTRMLLFYDREGGTGKTFSYDSGANISELNSWTDWATDWDVVLFQDFGTFNSIFYRRTDGYLRAYDFTSSGAKNHKLTQYIADPYGSTSGTKTGWDIVRGGRWSGGTDSLLFYHRTSGTAQFYRYDVSANSFVLAKTHVNWKHWWDQVEPGDFNGDGVDDLVLYNQDSGELKLVFLNASYEITGEQPLANAGISHGSRLALGKWGGSPRDDVMLYQHDNGVTPANGSARIWVDDPSGNRTLHVAHLDWSDRWTHLMPVDLPGAPRTGFLLYSNQRTVHVGVIPMSSSPSAPFPWTATDLSRIQAWEDAARKTYANAGILLDFFVFENTVQCPELAQWVCTEGDRDVADACIADLGGGFIPVAVATESPDAVGCSNRDVDFVKVGYPISGSRKHVGHEIGHYFGLPHSHADGAANYTHAGIEARLTDVVISKGRNAIARDVETDLNGGTDFVPVFDTPPTLADAYFKNEFGSAYADSMCDEGRRVDFVTYFGQTVSIWISPHDVMAYNNCDGVYGLTSDQARAVRQQLYGARGHLIGL